MKKPHIENLMILRQDSALLSFVNMLVMMLLYLLQERTMENFTVCYVDQHQHSLPACCHHKQIPNIPPSDKVRPTDQLFRTVSTKNNIIFMIYKSSTYP